MLVRELNLDQSVDTLARWMVHHVAEVMQAMESSVGSEKIVAEDRCRETILSLWKHLAYFPGGRDPLEEIKSLFATIKALDPENHEYFYSFAGTTEFHESEFAADTKSLLNLAREIDVSARMLIGMCLRRVASDISQEKHELLKLAESFDEEPSVSHVVNFLSDGDQELDDVLQDSTRKETVRALKERHTRLKSMVQLSRVMMKELEEEIQGLES